MTCREDVFIEGLKDDTEEEGAIDDNRDIEGLIDDSMEEGLRYDTKVDGFLDDTTDVSMEKVFMEEE